MVQRVLSVHSPNLRPKLEIRPLHEPSLGSSRRQEAQTSRAKGDQSLLTSAATNGGVVQGPNAHANASGGSP
jgi:hypothetical protein